MPKRGHSVEVAGPYCGVPAEDLVPKFGHSGEVAGPYCGVPANLQDHDVGFLLMF